MQEYPEDFERELAQQGDQQSFAYPRSVAVGVFVLCGLALLLLYVQLGNRLHLVVPKYGEAQIAGDVSQSILEAEEAQLKQQDSDEDGLTDYQELKVYGTSPFIADTDSDGVSDAAEVASGDDPNCPKGQNCFQTQFAFDSNSLQEALAQQKDRLQQVIDSPSEIRKLLIEQGANPQLLANIDDQTLQVLATEAYQEFSQPTGEKLDLLSSLDPDQLRELLRSVGLSDAQVESLTDEELSNLLQSVLDEKRTSTGASQ